MTEQSTVRSPVDTVAGIYRAFGAGDLEALFGLLADDVVFDADRVESSAQALGHPLLSARRGHTEVAGFFEELGRCEVHDFQVLRLLDGRDSGAVAAQVTIDLTYPSGVRIQDQEVHVWTVDDTGLATSMQHYADTAKHVAAWRGPHAG